MHRFIALRVAVSRALIFLPVMIFLNGCVSIIQPPDNSSTASPNVQAEVGFRSQVRANSFEASLNGTDVTAQFNPQPPAATRPQATFQNLAPGTHTLQVSADTLQYWFLFPYYASGSDTHTFTVTAPPLSFLPSTPRSINVGGNTAVTVTTPTAVAAATTVNLSSSNPGVAGVGASTTINAGQTTSGSVTVNGLAPGTSTITASAAGFAPAMLSVSVPTPDFEVEVTPATSEVAWGSSATYTVTVRSRNGFNSAIALTAADTPDASTPSFSPTSVTPPANGMATSTLTISTTEAQTEVGRSTFRVTGTDSANRARSDTAEIRILRRPGAFSGNVFPLISTSDTCGMVTANVVAGPRVQFTSPLGVTNPSPELGGGYQIAPGPNCRAAIVVPPLVGQPFVNLFNLQFPASTGARGINNPFNFADSAYDARFSPDQSIVAITQQIPTGQQSIILADIVTQRLSSSAAFDGILTSVTLTGNEATIIVNTVTGPNTFTLQLP